MDESNECIEGQDACTITPRRCVMGDPRYLVVYLEHSFFNSFFFSRVMARIVIFPLRMGTREGDLFSSGLVDFFFASLFLRL